MVVTLVAAQIVVTATLIDVLATSRIPDFTAVQPTRALQSFRA
jgi:hypothetical protein